jgi:hypothetical protein
MNLFRWVLRYSARYCFRSSVIFAISSDLLYLFYIVQPPCSLYTHRVVPYTHIIMYPIHIIKCSIYTNFSVPYTQFGVLYSTNCEQTVNKGKMAQN